MSNRKSCLVIILLGVLGGDADLSYRLAPMTQSQLPYEDTEINPRRLAYQLLEEYDDALNKSTFIERMSYLCPDKSIVEAIWEIIDLLTLGGR